MDNTGMNFTPSALRMVLIKGEAHRLPTDSRVHVIIGQAWVSSDGRDTILQDGDMLAVGSNAVISALDDRPLIFEMLEETREGALA
jgi:hypothetical protein